MSANTERRAEGLAGYFAAADVSREGLIARFSDLFLVAGIVVGITEHEGASTVTGEHQRGVGLT